MSKRNPFFIENCGPPKAISEKVNITLFRYPQYSEQIMKQQMRKRGLIQPDTVLNKGKRIDNLKDYQSIQWFCEIV